MNRPFLGKQFALRLFCCSAVFMAAIVAQVSAEDEVKLTDVVRVWRKREEATQSLRFEFAREYVTGKQTFLSTTGAAPTEPPADIKTNQRCVLVIDGNKMRFEKVGESWASSIKAPAPETAISVFDGAREKQLFKRERNDDLLHSKGDVATRKGPGDAVSVHLLPLLRHFRPFSSTFHGINPGKLKLVDTEVIDEMRCLVLEEPQEDRRRVAQFWVAPDRDMAIIRYARLFDGSIENQAEISLKHDPVHGWLPHRWRTIRLGNENKVLTSCTTIVTRFDINPRVSADEFDLVFPPGTEVVDRISNKTYLVKPDSSNREVLPQERVRGAKYSELMMTNPGDAARPNESHYSPRFVVTLFAVLLLAGGIVMWLRRKSVSS